MRREAVREKEEEAENVMNRRTDREIERQEE